MLRRQLLAGGETTGRVLGRSASCGCFFSSAGADYVAVDAGLAPFHSDDLKITNSPPKSSY